MGHLRSCQGRLWDWGGPLSCCCHHCSLPAWEPVGAVFSPFGSFEDHVGLVASPLGAEVVSLWGGPVTVSLCWKLFSGQLLMPVPPLGHKEAPAFSDRDSLSLGHCGSPHPQENWTFSGKIFKDSYFQNSIAEDNLETVLAVS